MNPMKSPLADTDTSSASASEAIADNSMSRGAIVLIIAAESPFCGLHAPIVSSDRNGSVCSLRIPGHSLAVWMTREDILP